MSVRECAENQMTPMLIKQKLDSSANLPAVIFGVCFWNKKSIRGLLSHLPGKPVFFQSFSKAFKIARKQNRALYAWSSRLTTINIQQCRDSGVSLIRIEDGFVRSVGLGAGFVPAASLIFDDIGIYYDGSRPSKLEYLLEDFVVTETQIRRGMLLRKRLVDDGISKYNFGDQNQRRIFPENKHGVLVPGQVSDDAAILNTISHSIDLESGKNPNLLLLAKARQTHPNAHIVFKPHPDVSSGLRCGAVADSEILNYADQIITDTDIISLIDQCDTVETISSLSGFEALLRKKKVIVHGTPFYAGWGLSHDTTKISRRSKTLTLDELTYITLICYGRYIHPGTFQPCEIEDVLTALTILRRSRSHKISTQIKLKIAWLGERMGL